MPQFDLEDRTTFYKGTTDNLVVGPEKPVPGSPGWHRAVSGSVVSGSQEFKASTLATDYLFKTTRPFARSGTVRFVRLSSATQIIQDSVPPSIFELFLAGSGSGSHAAYSSGEFGGNETFLKMIFALDAQPLTASNGYRLNNIEWSYSFPYEKKYQQLAVNASLGNDVALEWLDNGGSFVSLSTTRQLDPLKVAICTSVSGVVPGGAKKTVFNNYFDVRGYYDTTTLTFISTSYVGTFASDIEAAKLVFGVNPKPASVLDAGLGLAEYTSSYCTGSTIEGWRYGLYNGVPTKFSAVFRRDRYGQLSDMLQQRIYTKTFNNPEVGGLFDAEGGINFLSGAALSGEVNEYLTASIYKGIDVENAYVVNPYGSGIYDKEYRASQPWHDDDRRLR